MAAARPYVPFPKRKNLIRRTGGYVLTPMRHQGLACVFAILAQAVHFFNGPAWNRLRRSCNLQNNIPKQRNVTPVCSQQLVTPFAGHRRGLAGPQISKDYDHLVPAPTEQRGHGTEFR